MYSLYLVSVANYQRKIRQKCHKSFLCTIKLDIYEIIWAKAHICNSDYSCNIHIIFRIIMPSQSKLSPPTPWYVGLYWDFITLLAALWVFSIWADLRVLSLLSWAMWDISRGFYANPRWWWLWWGVYFDWYIILNVRSSFRQVFNEPFIFSLYVVFEYLDFSC